MTINLALGSIKAANHTATRTFAAHLGDVVNVKGFTGVVGDGINDDTAGIQAALNYAYGTTGSPHGDTATSNRPVFFPAGDYKITSALTLRSAKGAYIYGAGRFSTRIFNSTSNGSVFVTNGCEFSVFEAMQLVSNGTGVCFDLDWDNTGDTALQSNSFRDMFFEAGAYGLRIGHTGFMGSETTCLNCYFINQSVAGLTTQNGNACDNTVLGGNFAQCDIGILVGSGSVQIIHGVSFQVNTTYDISIANNAGDCYSIAGCRSESVNFLRLQNGTSALLSGSNQTNPTAGVFAFSEGSIGVPGVGAGTLSIDNCGSLNGTLTGNSTLYIRGNPALHRAVAITGAANNGSGLIRLTVTSTAAWATGQLHYVTGIAGSGNVLALNNTAITITVIDGTHIDVQGSTFSGSWTSGGQVDGTPFGNLGYISSFTGTVAQNI